MNITGSIHRLYYRKRNKNSCNKVEYGIGGFSLGYPETDKHFRERIIEIEKNKSKIK